MPTAIVSFVKQPDGIYLTAGQQTKIELSPCFGSPLLVFALSCSSSPHFFISVHLLQPIRPPSWSPPPSLRRSSWSAALQAGGVVLCETCLINEDPDLCYRGGPWSSTEAKSPPLIVPHLCANKRPRSLISLEMDYYPFCILLHPSRVVFPLSLPLQHISCFIYLFFSRPESLSR